MNRLKHLREERARIEGEMRSIFDKCETEKRSRTKEETEKYNKLKSDLEVIDLEMVDLEELEKREKRSAKPVGGDDKPEGPEDEEEEENGGEGTERRNRKPKDMSIRGQVAAWQKRNAETIKKIQNRQKAAIADLEPFELEFRAANSPMTPANTYPTTITMGAGALIRDGAPVIDLLRIQPTLWDLLPKGRTNKETYPWVNKKVPADSGAADFIGPGVAKPPISFTLVPEKSNAKKVAVSTKFATELLDDVDGFTSMVEDELRYQLKYEINRVLMSANAATSTDPAGIRSFAASYTLSGIQTQNPNNWDAVRAAIAQVRASYIDGPILVLMNPIDTANMEMSKAISAGTYLGLNLRPVPGGFIAEDYNVTAGDIMVIALDALKTLIYKEFMIAYGWENDDFTKNLVTAIAETRFHSFHSDNVAAGFLYEQIADIKTAIAIP